MKGKSREEQRRLIDQEAHVYRANRKKAMREFAANLQKERAVLDKAERSYGDEFSKDIKEARAGFDGAEREFYEQADRALREFNAALRQARRSIN